MFFRPAWDVSCVVDVSPASLPTPSVLLKQTLIAVCTHKCTELAHYAQFTINCCAKSKSVRLWPEFRTYFDEIAKQAAEMHCCFLHVLDFFFPCMFFELCLTIELLRATASPCLWGKLQGLHLDKSKRFVLWRSRERFRGLKLSLSTCRGETNKVWEAENIPRIKRMRERERLSPAGMIWGYPGAGRESILKKFLLLAHGIINAGFGFLPQI